MTADTDPTTDDQAVLLPAEPDRAHVRRATPERVMLDAWLDWHRATQLRKCAGLTTTQLRLQSAEPSTLTLLGLVRHMAEVERGWFHDLDGDEVEPLHSSDEDPEADFDGGATSDASADFAIFDREVARSREIAARHELDKTKLDRHGRDVSLRWIYLHMIEEYARHNGHADLLRERIDGATGD